MSLILSGSDGLSDVDGSASTPAIRGTDANTGIFFGADIIGFAEGGAEVMRIDSSGNVGIGTTSPANILTVQTAATGTTAGSNVIARLQSNASGRDATLQLSDNVANSSTISMLSGATVFRQNGTESARITSGGALLVGTNAQIFGSDFITNISGTRPLALKNTSTAAGDNSEVIWHVATSGDNRFIEFGTEGTYTIRGSIDYNRGGGQVRYNTTSDYRLKENIVDLPNALQTILQLKPRQFSWKETGNTTTGFIAHELQEVFPDCVSGEKDGIDADGNPRYQGVDTSFLVATLTAAIQELKSELDAAKARIAVLEAK